MSKAWISGLSSAAFPSAALMPALGGAGVAARRVELRDHGDVRARVVRGDRGAHPRAARADHEDVVRCLHV